MAFLLSNEFGEYANSNYPLFYKSKIVKKGGSNAYFYRNAIESALKSNQAGAVVSIIKYIVNHQNNYISSFLFTKIFTQLIEKGIVIKSLLQSNVFLYQIEVEEWPTSHYNPTECLRACSENMFLIENHYKIVFPEEEF